MSARDGGHHAPNSVPPEWGRRILTVFWAGCALLVILDFVIHRHIYHELERIPAFHALFGFVGLAVLIQLSKGLRRLVMRPEDYYDAPELPGDESAFGEGGGRAH